MVSIYLKLGFDHILDYAAIDHILFVLTLCAIYAVQDWKKILVLITAFTIGHSLTLALSVMNIVTVNPNLIEKLIPITIILTALANIYNVIKNRKSGKEIYSMSMVFGFIHGMGFSNYLKAIMGSEENVILPLFSFNIGVELGQIIIVALGMLLSYLFINKLHFKQNNWTIFVSTIAIVVSLKLLLWL